MAYDLPQFYECCDPPTILQPLLQRPISKLKENSKINLNVVRITIGSTPLPTLLRRLAKIGFCVDLRCFLKTEQRCSDTLIRGQKIHRITFDEGSIHR